MRNPLSEFRGYAEGNKFSFITDQEEENFKKYLTSKKSKTKKRTEFKIIVKEYNSGRTSGQAHEKSNQNGYYWGVIIYTLINSDPFIGHTPEDMNYGLRCLFMRTGGTDAFPATESFSKLKKGPFEKKMEEIRIWALTEYGIKIETVEDYYNNN